MVLFICNGNVARSQVAAELYRKRANREAVSAGTKVSARKAGVVLEDDGPLAENAIYCIQAITGIDLSKKRRTPLSKELCSQSSQIIIMADRDSLPEYFSDFSGKSDFWNIEDPKDLNLEGYKLVIDQIARRVDSLVFLT